MAYYIAEIKSHKDLEDAISSLLLDQGAEGVSSEGAHLIKKSIEAGLAEIWDDEDLEDCGEVIVKGYFSEDGAWEDKKSHVAAAVAVLRSVFPEYPIEDTYWLLDDESWQDSWKQYYKPFRIGNHLVIKPQWEPYEEKDGDIVLELDPGLAFGTGSHPTTGGALKLLEQETAQGMKVMDFGCGTGILAVAAGLLGANEVYAVDVDREAIQATVKNIRINGLMTTVEVLEKDLLKENVTYLRNFDIIVANIVADVIIALLPQVDEMLKPGGALIAGGIIDTKQNQVFHALEERGFRVAEVITEGNWITILTRR